MSYLEEDVEEDRADIARAHKREGPIRRVTGRLNELYSGK